MRLTTFLLDLHLYLCFTQIRTGYKSVKHALNLCSHTRARRSLPHEGSQPRVQGLAFSYLEVCRRFQLPLVLHHQSGLVRLETSEAVLTGFLHITKSPYKNTPK